MARYIFLRRAELRLMGNRRSTYIRDSQKDTKTNSGTPPPSASL